MNREVKVINYQIFLSFILMLSIFVSIILSYNTSLSLQKKKTLFNKRTTFIISKYRNLIALILSILFLYLNYINKDIAKEKNDDLKSFDLQIIASYFVIIASFIAYYVVITTNKDVVSDIENPII